MEDHLRYKLEKGGSWDYVRYAQGQMDMLKRLLAAPDEFEIMREVLTNDVNAS